MTGKKIDDAIKAGLKELGVSLAEVNVEILQQGGLFRKAKVRLTVVEDDQPAKEKAVVKAQKEEKAVNKEPKEVKAAPCEAKQQQKPVQKTEKPAVKPSGEVKEKKESRPANPAVKEKKPVADTRPAPLKPVEQESAPESKPAKVDENQVKVAKDYLEKLLSLMKIDAKVETDTSHGNIDINLVTEDSAVIGHRGEVLDALQILTKRAVEESNDKFVHVNVDSHNYRVKREQSLVALANRMASKCIRTGRKVVLEPMNNTHRKIIHSTLSANEKVVTKSEGKEPNRRVVIFPKRYEKKQ